MQKWLRTSGQWLIEKTAPLPLCDDRCRIGIIWLSCAAILTIAAVEYWRFDWDWRQWDILLLSGIAALTIALMLVGRIQHLSHDCLRRLNERGVINLNSGEIEATLTAIDHSADQWGRVFAPVVAVLMALAFALALYQNFWFPRLLLGIIQTGIGYAAGGYIGRMVRYGQLGAILNGRKIAVTVNPWHGDQVGGLSPVGRLFFSQAMIIAIPALFLAFWSVAMPVWPRDYLRWTEAYLMLLTVAILLELTAFLWPLWSFHRIMLRDRAERRKTIDNLYRSHMQNKESLIEEGNLAGAQSANADLDILAREYRTMEQLPTWPIETRVRVRFTVNNALLVAPLLSELASKKLGWPNIPNSIVNFAKILFA